MHAGPQFCMQNTYGNFLVWCGTVILVMWVADGKHRAGLYLQAWAAWLAQPNQIHNFYVVNNFQYWEDPKLAKLSPALILGYSFNAHILPFSSDSHSSQPRPKNLGLSAKWWFPVLLCLNRTRGNQTNPNIDWEGFALRFRLGNEGHSQTGQGKKVSDSFPRHWENSTDECTLFSLIIQHERENPTTEPPRVCSLRWALPQRGRLDRNRCDNKWPLELHPESCWLFPESCSSSWASGFTLETLRSWHIAKKGQQQKQKNRVQDPKKAETKPEYMYI